jgi:hypothetical protein
MVVASFATVGRPILPAPVDWRPTAGVYPETAGDCPALRWEELVGVLAAHSGAAYGGVDISAALA